MIVVSSIYDCGSLQLTSESILKNSAIIAIAVGKGGIVKSREVKVWDFLAMMIRIKVLLNY